MQSSLSLLPIRKFFPKSYENIILVRHEGLVYCKYWKNSHAVPAKRPLFFRSSGTPGTQEDEEFRIVDLFGNE